MKKLYDVQYGPNWWECTIQIDETKETGERIVAMVEFWHEWGFRLLMNDGNYIKTFLQQLAREINYIQIQENVNLIGVVAAFENREGWCKMDGSMGIEIMAIDEFEFKHSDYQVQEGLVV